MGGGGAPACARLSVRWSRAGSIKIGSGASMGQRRGVAMVTRATGGGGGEGGDPRRPSEEPPKKLGFNKKRAASPQFSAEAQTWVLLGGVATSLTIIVALVVAANDEAAYFGGPDDFSYMGDDYGSYGGVGGVLDAISPGNVLAAAIWSFGLFFKSPLQILLVFLGRTDTERPSDWMLRTFAPGDTPAGRPLTFEDASVAAKSATLAFFTLCGCAIVTGFDSLFAGEETWAVSAGMGFTMLSFVAELGSPQRYTSAELDVLEAQYADFCAFADGSLQRRGRCHGVEVSRAFRRRFPAYADEATLSEKDLRTMILNWHPSAERTSSGYYKNLSLQEGVDQRSKITVKDLGL